MRADDRERGGRDDLARPCATRASWAATGSSPSSSRLAARARLRLLGPAEPPGAVAAGETVDEPFGLTPRERQVLALVARGATNREIGLELHMAEKTASVHVSRILAKLDVRSRTEAAAVALRQGLVDTEAAV